MRLIVGKKYYDIFWQTPVTITEISNTLVYYKYKIGATKSCLKKEFCDDFRDNKKSASVVKLKRMIKIHKQYLKSDMGLVSRTQKKLKKLESQLKKVQSK